MKKEEIIPVILGGDLNAYSVAHSFYLCYSVVSHVFARSRCADTDNSKFIKTHICSGLDDKNIAIPELLKFARAHKDKELYLIPSTDTYLELVQNSHSLLSAYYVIQISDFSHYKELSDKSLFYKRMADADISIPRGFSALPKEDYRSSLSKLEAPYAVKPAISREYRRYTFFGIRTVYFHNTKREVINTVERIFASGYREGVVIQEQINNSTDRILTTFSDSRGRVVRAAYGEVILEDSGQASQKNHAAIITLPLDKICFEIIGFLNSIGYKGFAEVDILVNKDGKYVIGINQMQGRSCDYLRGCGINIAQLLVENRRYGRLEAIFTYKECYWHYPRHIDVIRYSRNKRSILLADMLYGKGLSLSPYDAKCEGIMRKIYVYLHNRRLSKAMRRDALSQGV